MHREEFDELLTCAGCGGVVGPRDRVYNFGAEGALCFSCAVQRGGEYDSVHDRWTSNPDVSDVAQPED